MADDSPLYRSEKYKGLVAIGGHGLAQAERGLDAAWAGESSHVSFRYCGTVSIPDNIGEIPGLKGFTCHGTHVSAIPASLGKSPTLENFSCSGCLFLESIPAGFTGLRTFKCESSGLVSLPEELGADGELTHVYIGNTGIRRLPPTLHLWKKLVQFDGVGENPDTDYGLMSRQALAAGEWEYPPKAVIDQIMAGLSPPPRLTDSQGRPCEGASGYLISTEQLMATELVKWAEAARNATIKAART